MVWGGKDWMVLCSEKMLHKWTKIPRKSFMTENIVPNPGKSIAETVGKGYNSSETFQKERFETI